MSTPSSLLMSYLQTLDSDDKTAIMFSGSLDDAICIGKQGEVADEHPAANLLHKINKLKRSETILMNYPPSYIELGMMWRAGQIKNAYYIHSHKPLVIKQYHIDQDGFELLEKCDLDAVGPLSSDDTIRLEQSLAFQKALRKVVRSRSLDASMVTTLKQGVGLQLVSGYLWSQAEEQDEVQERIDETMIRVVMGLVDRAWTDKSGSDKPEQRIKGNNIGAIMLDRDGKLIGWGLNLKGANKTFHAETLMIEQYLRENNVDRLPDGVTIYTSLECCHMCAGHIAELGKNARVIYAQEDPYFEGQNALKRGVNGTSQQKSSLPYVDIFRDKMADDNDILSFLFSSHSKDIFERSLRDQALFNELILKVVERFNRKFGLDMTFKHHPDLALRGELMVPMIKQFFEALERAGAIKPLPSVKRRPSPTSQDTLRSVLKAAMTERRKFFLEPPLPNGKKARTDLPEVSQSFWRQPVSTVVKAQMGFPPPSLVSPVGSK